MTLSYKRQGVETTGLIKYSQMMSTHFGFHTRLIRMQEYHTLPKVRIIFSVFSFFMKAIEYYMNFKSLLNSLILQKSLLSQYPI